MEIYCTFFGYVIENRQGEKRRKHMGHQEAAQLFNTIPDNDICGLYEKGGINFRKVIDTINFKNEDVAIATNLPQKSMRFDSKMSNELKKRLTEWAIAINLVATYFKDASKTNIWFQVPNPLFGGITPRDMIRLGRFKKLMKYIQSALDENKRD
jgi:hypothetical protein